MFNRNKNKKKKIPSKRKKNTTVVRSYRKRRFKVFFDDLKLSERLKSKYLWIGVLSIVLVIAGVLGINYIKKSDWLRVKEIHVIIDNLSAEKTIEDALSKYKGYNILNINTDDIKSEISNSITSVANIYINKSYTGLLNIEVIQDLPVYYLVNLKGSYLLNRDGKVIEIINQSGIELKDYEQAIINGTGDPNADYVKIVYLSRIEDVEDRKKVSWKDVSVEDKQKVLDDITNEIKGRVSDYFTQSRQILSQRSLTNVITFEDSLAEKYNLGDYVKIEKINLVSGVSDYFKQKNMVIRKLQWTSPYTLDTEMDSGQHVLFSVKRDSKDQFVDLDTLIYYGQFQQFREIDVRSDIFSGIK